MEPKVFTNRSSLAGSAAREAESMRAPASSVRLVAGGAAQPAEAGEPRAGSPGGSVRMGLRFQAGAPKATPERLFPGPSARPAAPAPVFQAAPESASAASLPPAQVQQAPYPQLPQPGTVTSVGTRVKHAFRSLFT